MGPTCLQAVLDRCVRFVLLIVSIVDVNSLN